MPGGVVFLIVVPTANFERDLYGYKRGESNPAIGRIQPSDPNLPNNLNLNVQESNALLKLEVELRDKNAGRYGRGSPKKKQGLKPVKDLDDVVVPMEKVLQELLTKLDIEQVTWYNDKKGCYFHVIFPIPSGEPCETTLHCLTELGFGKKLNSSVNVLPCSVCYDALSDPNADRDDIENDSDDLIKWNNFVESIKSKLTVKQVVDGVRGGGALSFDYILLIVTADSLAALGLIENNAPNITAAMLVSPLMGPVMSITFGTIISDKDLVKVGFVSLIVGMFISLLFGFIFGLIVGTTEMPWGLGDWPTEEMRGRGNARSLWMGILWALTSGTGVAVALLQGSAGPLIGVAISASLLPPVVNCGLFWALACIWLIYPDIKIPHLKGEPYNHTKNSSYPYLYTNYLPTEFLINGIVSGLLTVINVICIFITAIIVLKIKEVSAPYTASPDVQRFWETDLRTVRKSNRSTIRKKGRRDDGIQYEGLLEPRNRQLETVFEQAIKEATSDPTFNKVKRMSYSSNAGGELSQRLQSLSDHRVENPPIEEPTITQDTKSKADLDTLDKLISSLLLERSNLAEEEQPLNRWKKMSRSFSSRSFRGSRRKAPLNYLDIEHRSLMPTIMENNQPGRTKNIKSETLPLVDYKQENERRQDN